MPPRLGPEGVPPRLGPEGVPPRLGPEGVPPRLGPEGVPPRLGPEGVPPRLGPEGTVGVPPNDGPPDVGAPAAATGATAGDPVPGVPNTGTCALVLVPIIFRGPKFSRSTGIIARSSTIESNFSSSSVTLRFSFLSLSEVSLTKSIILVPTLSILIATSFTCCLSSAPRITLSIKSSKSLIYLYDYLYVIL